MTTFFDMDGNPLTVEEWGERFGNYESRVLCSNLVGSDLRLVTLWLGYVETLSENARLFGTALLSAGTFLRELETYDNRYEALNGHARHLAALRADS